MLGAALSGSLGSYESTRRIDVSGAAAGQPFSFGSASADQTIRQVTLRGTGRYEISAEGAPTYIAPRLDLDATFLRAFSASEKGGGAAGVRLSESDQVVFAATPSLEIGMRREEQEMSLALFARAGVMALSTDELTQDAALLGAPGSAGTFSTAIGVDRITGVVEAGFLLEDANGLSLGLGYRGAFGDRAEAHDLTARLQIRF